MILKAGTYSFNDTIPKPTTWVSQDLSFTVIMEGDTFTITRVMVDDYGLDAYVEEMGSTFYGYGWAENTWFSEGLETWTFANDTEVDDIFGTWYISNTNYNQVNSPKLTLKAGTYRFNDVLKDFPEIDLGNAIDYFIPISFNYNGMEYLCLYYGWLAFSDGGAPLETLTFMETYPTFDENEPEIPEVTIWGYHGGGVGNSYAVETPVYVTINRDAEVNNTFGTFFITNTNYNEVNAKPLAEITYNGETIAQLNAGETATLSCEGKKMASDVVVKIGKLTNGATAYTVSSVDELPSNAVDGSMAIVPSESIIGKYRWNETLDFDALNLPAHDGFENGTESVCVYMQLIDETAGLCEQFAFWKEDGALCLYLSGTLLYNESYGWDDSFTELQLLSEVFAVSNITMSDEGFDITIEDFITWFNQSTERLSGGYSLYTHENGQWVYKCEVV